MKYMIWGFDSFDWSDDSSDAWVPIPQYGTFENLDDAIAKGRELQESVYHGAHHDHFGVFDEAQHEIWCGQTGGDGVMVDREAIERAMAQAMARQKEIKGK